MRRILILTLVLLMSAAPALAADYSYTENLDAYTQKYAGQLSSYRTYAVGTSNERIKAYAEKLQALGYYPVTRVTEQRLTEDMGNAIALLKQQMGIGGKDGDLTPLVQAMLDGGDVLPPEIAPVYPRHYSPDSNKFATHTLAQIARLRSGDKCALRGEVVGIQESADGSTVSLTLRPEGQEGKARVSYVYPARSSRFLEGDMLLVFATVDTASGDVPELRADLIGFAK